MSIPLDNPDQKLVPFLREIANQIESEELAPELLQSVGEFYMSYTMQQAISHDIEASENNGEFNTMDAIKFITLGWYIYTFILATERDNRTEQDKSEQDKSEQEDEDDNITQDILS